MMEFNGSSGLWNAFFNRVSELEKIIVGAEYGWLGKAQIVLKNSEDSLPNSTFVEDYNTFVEAKTREEAIARAKDKIYQKFDKGRILAISFSEVEVVNRKEG